MSATVTPIGGEHQAVDARAEYDRVCAELLTDSDFQDIGSKRYKKRSAWRILANHYGLSCQTIARDYERDGHTILRAEAVDVATDRDGRKMDGVGSCDAFERCCRQPCWRTRYDDHVCCDDTCNGVRHFTHAQHDIPATAATRARNRAIADLIGFGEVSAEELVGEGEDTPPAPKVVEPIGEPDDTNVWLDVLGNPAGWEDLRFSKRSMRSPDFRARPGNPHWGAADTYRGKPAPMALWLDGAEPEGLIEVLTLRDQGLPVDAELLASLSDVVEVTRFRPEKTIEQQTKGEIAEHLDETFGVKFTANQLARTSKPKLIDQLHELQAKAAGGASAGEPVAVGLSDGCPVSPAAPPTDVLPECAICGSDAHARVEDPSGARCKDLAGCMKRVEAAADESIEAGDAA